MRSHAVFFLLFSACTTEKTVAVYNNPPTASITSHSDGVELQAGYEVLFQANVGDGNHEMNELSVTWSSNTRTLCEAQNPTIDGTSVCAISLEEDENLVRIQVVDPENETALDEISLSIIPTFAPTIEITSPVVTGIYYSDQLTLLSAVLQDNEDAAEDLSYQWESSIDGVLSTTSEPSADGQIEDYVYLSEGNQVLSLTATDLSGKSTTKTVSFDVGGPNTNPDCAITSPVSGETFVQGEAIVFQGIATDEEIESGDLNVSWISDQDGLLGTGLVNSDGSVSFTYADLSSKTHTVQFSVEDELGSTCSASIIVSVGTPPTLSLTSPSNGDVFSVGEVVQFQGTVSDNEEIASNLSISWVSDIDGEISTQPANSNGDLALNLSTLSAGQHNITVIATDTIGLTDSALLSVRINSLPTLPDVVLAPNPATSIDDLNASASGSSDPDGENVLYSYTWMQNNQPTAYNGSFLPSSATTKGEQWTVRVTPNDGFQDGPFVEASVIIQNTAPSIDSLSLSGTTASTSDTVSCMGLSSDMDGDTLSEFYVWTNESTGVPLGSSASASMSPLSVAPGDTISCTYTVDDGTSSVSQNTYVSIVNSDPVISSVMVVPSSPFLNDEVSCIGVVNDPDLEAIANSYLWKNETTGNIISMAETLTLDSTVAMPTEEISCTLTVQDPSGGTHSMSETVTVGNHPPVIDSIGFNLSSVGIGDTINCVTSVSDQEGEIPTVDYEWTNSSTGNTIGSSSSITIMSGMATGLDELLCTATASDSYGDTDVESASIVLDPSMPEFTTAASISPSSGTTTSSTLSCTGVAVDPDGGSITLAYEWTNGSAVLGTSSSITLDPGLAQPTDQISCTITATDPTGEQAVSAASVQIGNSAPALSNISISPSTAVVTSSTLTCSVSVSDADNETLSPSYEWRNGSSVLGSGDTLTLDTSLAQPSDDITCVASVEDGYGASDTLSSSVTVENTVPVISSVSISPSTIYNDSTLTCSVSASDVDNQSLTEAYTWSNATTGFSLGTGSVLSVNSGVASRGDSIVCAVDVTDSSGATVSSTSSMTIDNREPTMPTVSLSPAVGYIDSTLTCTASGSVDPDGDTVSYLYSWNVGGTPLSENTSTLSAAFAADDVVTCTVTPSDGLLSGTAGNASMTISNSTPNIDSLSLSPDPLYTDDPVVASAFASDTDGDSLTLYYTWTVDGNEVQSGTGNTLSSTYFSKNETVTVSVVADDGSTTSAALTSSLLCNNTAPTAPSISVSPADPMEQTDALQCIIDITSGDVDGDSISYDFAWTVDGTPYSGSTVDSSYAGDTIPASETYIGTWECSVTPNDGTDNGASATASVGVTTSDPCINYGGTVVDVNANIKVCDQAGVWGAWDNNLIPGNWQVCTTSQWSSYAPSGTPQSFGLVSLWIDNSSCGGSQHREVFESYPMNDSNCYNGSSCCWSDSTVLRFAICSP